MKHTATPATTSPATPAGGHTEPQERSVRPTTGEAGDFSCGNGEVPAVDSSTAAVDSSTAADSDDTTFDHVIKYTGLFGGIQGLVMLMNVVRNKIAALLLGTDGLALINLYNSAIRLTNEGTNFGISFSAVKHIAQLDGTHDTARIQAEACTVRTWSLFTALLGVLVCMILAPWLSRWTFESADYTTEYLLLSPMVGMLSVMSGELAILKGLKQLRRVALYSLWSAATLLIVSLPAYYLWHIDGILAALLLSQAAALALSIRYAHKVVPYRIALFSTPVYAKGLPMVRLGMAFIVAGIFGQGAEYVIRARILHLGTLADVGLYYSGYAIAVTYASLIFTAFEPDYFPRLSAVVRQRHLMNTTVNRQIEVSVLLMAPFLIFFVLFMPLILPLLYSAQFAAAVPMAIVASYFMFFKSATLPVAYLPLASGDSTVYMVTELIYDLFVALAIPAAFGRYGLMGAGWALSAGGLVNLLLIHIYYRARYRFRLRLSRLKLYAAQFALFTLAVYAVLQHGTTLRVLLGGAALTLSLLLSLRILGRETTLIAKIRARLWRR